MNARSFLFVFFATYAAFTFAGEQCVPLSNLQNEKREFLWLRKATIAKIAAHQIAMNALIKSRGNESTRSISIPELRIVPGPGEVLVIRHQFSGWSDWKGSETVSEIVIATETPMAGIGVAHIGKRGDALVYVRSGSPAFGRYREGYGVKGSVGFVAPDKKGPSIREIGSNAVWANIRFDAIRAVIESGDEPKACAFEASAVFSSH